MKLNWCKFRQLGRSSWAAYRARALRALVVFRFTWRTTVVQKRGSYRQEKPLSEIFRKGCHKLINTAHNDNASNPMGPI